MPAVRLKKRISPTGQFARAQQVNGLYIHSSPPKVLQMNPSVIRQWLRGGDVDQLEQVILEGQGHKLIGEYAPDPKVRAFLKEVPNYMGRIGELNDAVNKGSLKQLQSLEPRDSEPFLKNVMMCKDHSGVGLLHKAVYNDHPDIVKWLLKRYPETVSLKDRDGKTALHYCGVCGNPDGMWSMLLQAGSDPAIMDARGKTAAYYMERPDDIQLPEPKNPSPSLKRFTSGKHGLVVKPSNIRIWIHDRDLGRLQQVLWEGHGSKLRVETSNHPKVKKFLDGVPYIMNVIKDVHTAAINGDLPQFTKKTTDPIPPEVLISKDANGLTPLHKAAGLGHVQIVREILDRLPKAVYATDADGRTPLHYAVAAKDNSAQVIKCLREHGADPMVFDSTGKMPSYYNENPRDIPHKLLEVIPEAPRLSQIFPPSLDWSILHSSSANLGQLLDQRLVNQTHSNKFNDVGLLGTETNETFNAKGVDIWENVGNQRDYSDDDDDDEQPPDAIPLSTNIKPALNGLNATYNLVKEKDNLETEKRRKEEEVKEKNRLEAEKKKVEEEKRKQDDNNRREAEKKKVDDEKRKQENNNRREAEERTKKLDEDRKQQDLLKQETAPRIAEETRRAEEEKSKINEEEKRERELAEERQRLLDEGLIARPVSSEESEEDDGDGVDDEEIKKLIAGGEMEALANLVLEGEGRRLLGYKSKNSETRAFLQNVPSYISKIEAVHKAAREGELRAMQAALDRRRFAISKDTALKVTPLHIATLFGKTPIIKYLGGRFPETLKATDKAGRTALHYAACIPDNGHYFNLLSNLGADKKQKDKSGNIAQYYMDHPNELTQESLLKDLSAPSQVAKEMLSDKEFPLFGTEEGKYLADALGEPLTQGLTDVAAKRPTDPIAHLARFLHDFSKRGPTGVGSPVRDPTIRANTPSVFENEAPPMIAPIPNKSPHPGTSSDERDQEIAFNATNRDEYGQSILHFAAARSQGRNSLFQLIQESGVNIGYRDELYRTARDVAVQANIRDNVREIDKYVLSLAARGETERLIELLLEGYDHLLDIEDDDDKNIIEIVNAKEQNRTLAFLRSIPSFEEKRERLQRAVRAGDDPLVQQMMTESEGAGRLLAIGKSTTGRCCLHVAVLCQRGNSVEFIARRFPETLKLGDNLDRTALHYAMGMDDVEAVSNVLIKCGAERVAKDLKGRQPSYYFMNKSEIQRLQEEEQLLQL